MSKKIYEILNNTSKIDTTVMEDMNDMEKQRFKNNFKNRNKSAFKAKKKVNKKAIIAAAAAFALISRTNLATNVYAAFESRLNSFSYSIARALNNQVAKDYSQVLNTTVEQNNIGIKLTDVLIDQDELVFSSLIDTSFYNNTDGIDFTTDIYIDGKKIYDNMVSGSIGSLRNEKGLYNSISKIYIPDLDLNNDLDIKLVIRNFKLYDNNKSTKVRGKWIFDFTANGFKLDKNSISSPINYEFTFGEDSYVLDNIRYNPVNQVINARVLSSNANYDLALVGQDDLGNKVVFNLFNKSDELLRFETDTFKPNPEAKSITLKPYAVKLPEKSGQISNDFKPVGKEFTINLDK